MSKFSDKAPDSAAGPHETFIKERLDDAANMANDRSLRNNALDFMIQADRYKYSYNFTWLGRPIIKLPEDIVAIQEAIWETKPDLVIETGIAHGGSLILTASILALIGKPAKVIGIDLDIRAHNRKAIEDHPLFDRIIMIEGNSVAPEVHRQVGEYAKDAKSIMVILDSLHTHDHVLNELRLYAPLVSVGSYLILPDTFIENFPPGYYAKSRPWDVGNNPATALKSYLAETPDTFRVESKLQNKLLITEAPDGYLRRIR